MKNFLIQYKTEEKENQKIDEYAISKNFVNLTEQLRKKN